MLGHGGHPLSRPCCPSHPCLLLVANMFFPYWTVSSLFSLLISYYSPLHAVFSRSLRQQRSNGLLLQSFGRHSVRRSPTLSQCRAHGTRSSQVKSGRSSRESFCLCPTLNRFSLSYPLLLFILVIAFHVSGPFLSLPRSFCLSLSTSFCLSLSGAFSLSLSFCLFLSIVVTGMNWRVDLKSKASKRGDVRVRSILGTGDKHPLCFNSPLQRAIHHPNSLDSFPPNFSS